jgi:hypothetical protein
MKFLLPWFLGISVCAVACAATTRTKPNIVFVMSDDVGYGDLGCYGATRVKTPKLDQLAREGVRFTDQHSPAAMCTPARYTFFTGQYAFRLPGMGVAAGNAPLLISPGTPTVASVLKQAGYNTALVGKVAPWARSQRVGFQRGLKTRPPRAWLRLRVFHSCHRRSRPLRLCGKSSGRGS